MLWICGVDAVFTVHLRGSILRDPMNTRLPAQDTEAKLRALGPALRGDMLDVCTGLGYTSIAAAREARVSSVTTIELDPLMARICMCMCM